MAIPASLDDDLEHRVQELGRRLIAVFEQRRKAARSVDLWLDRFLNQVMQSEGFRVQALRSVDVLPALDDDRELTEHLHEYFGHGDFPLTGLLRFGVRHVRGDFANAIIGGSRFTARLKPILLAARRSGSFVCVDMEQFHLKETVLSCFKQVLMEPELSDWPDAGIALQAYLRETEADLNDLSVWAARRGTLR